MNQIEQMTGAGLRRAFADQTERLAEIRSALDDVPRLRRELREREDLRTRILEEMQEQGEA